MKLIGIITTSVVGVAALIGLAIGVRSLPEVRRYFKMRSM